ncbi:hypothetical protein S83_043540, partial [Arachis hypogaea]
SIKLRRFIISFPPSTSLSHKLSHLSNLIDPSFLLLSASSDKLVVGLSRLRSRVPSLPSSSLAVVAAALGPGRRRRSVSCHCLVVSLAPSLPPSTPRQKQQVPDFLLAFSNSSASFAQPGPNLKNCPVKNEGDNLDDKIGGGTQASFGAEKELPKDPMASQGTQASFGTEEELLKDPMTSQDTSAVPKTEVNTYVQLGFGLGDSELINSHGAPNPPYGRASEFDVVNVILEEGPIILHSFINSMWREAFMKAYKAMDKELRSHPNLDCFCSGSTAVTIVKQKIGNSRAIMGSKDSNDSMVVIQLTIDLNPDLPSQIKRCKGKVFALQDEPEVPRVWLPFDDALGLAIARVFGDFCLKVYGVISIPEFSHRLLTDKDEFIVLASDG